MPNWTIKKLSTLAVAAFVFLVFSGIAKADDIGTYTLENVTFDGGGTASGSFSYDFTTNSYTAITLSTQDVSGVADQTFSLTGPDALVPDDFSYTTGFCAGCNPGPIPYDQFTLNNGTDVFWLDLSLPAMTPGTDPLVPDLLDPNGVPLDLYTDLGYDCTNSQEGFGPGCYAAAAVGSGAVSASISTISTPEPSTSTLLLVGCLALLAGYCVRRKTPAYAPNEA